MKNLQAKAQKVYNQNELAIAKLDKKLIDQLYIFLDAVEDGQFPEQDVRLDENEDVVLIGIRGHEIVGREIYTSNVVDIDVDDLSLNDKNFIIGQIALGLDPFDADDDDDDEILAKEMDKMRNENF